MTTPSEELLTTLSTMIAQALQQSVGNMTQQIVAEVTKEQEKKQTNTPAARSPTFSASEYRSADGTPVSEYFDRFEWALELSKIPAEQHGDYARVYMGAELNNALKFLVSPGNPAEVSFTVIRSTLSNHFDRTRNKFVESVKFRQTIQNKNESIAQYALRLKQNAAYCDYCEFLDRMLIEQFLHGLEVRHFCDNIIAKNPTTFKEAYDTALTLEATQNTTREINVGVPKDGLCAESLNKLGYETPRTRKNTYPSSQRAQQPCFSERGSTSETGGLCNGCGGSHMRNQCKFREAKCNKCNKIGHIARVCRSVRRMFQSGTTSQVTATEDPATEIDTVQTLNQVCDRNVIKKKIIDVTINGKPLQMELDTGAPCGIVSESTLRQIQQNFTLRPADRQFASYTGHHITCLGRLPVNVSVGSTQRRLNIYVVSGETDPLFGREWIPHFIKEIDINRMFTPDEQIHALTSREITPTQEMELRNLLNTFQDTFSDIPGKLSGPPAKVHLKTGASPIFSKARDVPLSFRDRYAAEIEKKNSIRFF